MNLSTIIRQARNGELKSLSTKDKTDEVIVDYINLAMIALYGRFQLEIGEALITLYVGNAVKTIYSLDGITDTDYVDVSDGAVMTILTAYDEAGEIPINDDSNPLGIFTIGINSIQVPLAVNSETISLIYKIEPTEIVYVDDNGSATEAVVNIPKVLLEPMLHYIGYRAHGSVDGNVQAENNTHLMRFESSCKRVDALGLVPTNQYNRNVNVKGFM